MTQILPALADSLQQRPDDARQRQLEVVDHERLVEERADLGGVAASERVEDAAQVLIRRAGRLRGERAQQRRRLADAEALAQPLAQPFHA